MDKTRIEKIRPEHYARVAEIWRRELPEDFCSELGTAFLREVYLPFCFSLPGATGFVAVGGTGSPLGFVLSAPAEGFLARLAKAHFWRLTGAVAWRLLTHPSFLFYLLTIVVLVPYEPKVPGTEGLHELLYICVSRETQSKAIGSRLTARLLEELPALGCRGLVVKTLAKTEGTNRFYLRNGFTLADSYLGRKWYFRAIGAL